MVNNKVELPKVSKPAQRAFTQAGCRYLEDLTKYTEEEIASLHGVGPKVMKQVKQAFSDNGLRFAENDTKG